MLRIFSRTFSRVRSTRAAVPRRAIHAVARPGPSSRTPWLATVGLSSALAGVTLFAGSIHLDSDSPVGTNGAAPSAHAPRQVPYTEVQKHASKESCWVIIEGQVYDVTSFLPEHPGGAAVVIKNSGRDATKAFAPIHPPGTLSMLDPKAHIGPVDPATIPAGKERVTEEELRIQKARAELPAPEGALNLHDIEMFAQRVLSNTAWGYYRSAGDDEYTIRANTASFKRWWFRPRILNRISATDLSSSMLGMPLGLPIFIAPAALARLGHPDGEMNLTRAAGRAGIVQGISNNASCSIEEVMSVKVQDQGIVFQLYMNKDRAASEKLIRSLESRGFKAIMLTVDAAVAGKRELDQRAKGDVGAAAPAQNGSATTGLGVAHAIMGYQDPDVCWEDVPWIQSLTRLPLVLKGIQCVEDAEKAFEHGVQGIVLSNHGGRSLDFAPPPMEVLRELNIARPDLVRHPRFEVFLDGGITRGTDVIKAICLGVRAVGLGRAFLYANGVWGEAGCTRVIDIIREEMTTSMRLLGVTRIDQLGPHLVRYVDRDPDVGFSARL